MSSYLAGPRSDIPEWNTPAFELAAADLRARGFSIVSPLELGGEAAEAMIGEMVPLDEATYWRTLMPCIAVVSAPGIHSTIVLPGWQHSRGARLETFVTHLRGNPVYAYPRLKRVHLLRLAVAWALGR